METEILLSEIIYKAVRSSGAGGQNVNKVSSKVVLSFNLNESKAFTDEQKTLISEKLASRLTNDTVLILNCDEDRSQLKNKVLVTKRCIDILKKAIQIPKVRKETKIPKAVVRKRIEDKKNVSEIKNSRRKPDLD
jgi:ribosome-associated protein